MRRTSFYACYAFCDCKAGVFGEYGDTGTGALTPSFKCAVEDETYELAKNEYYRRKALPFFYPETIGTDFY